MTPAMFEDVMVVCGGVIPSKDYDYLYEHGAKAIFGPGTVIPDSAKLRRASANHLFRVTFIRFFHNILRITAQCR